MKTLKRILTNRFFTVQAGLFGMFGIPLIILYFYY
jgi:hypothetical protein